MNFRTRHRQYLQNIQDTQANPQATPELSLLPHLQTFLEDMAEQIQELRREIEMLKQRQIVSP